MKTEEEIRYMLNNVETFYAGEFMQKLCNKFGTADFGIKIIKFILEWVLED